MRSYRHLCLTRCSLHFNNPLPSYGIAATLFNSWASPPLEHHPVFGARSVQQLSQRLRTRRHNNEAEVFQAPEQERRVAHRKLCIDIDLAHTRKGYSLTNYIAREHKYAKISFRRPSSTSSTPRLWAGPGKNYKDRPRPLKLTANTPSPAVFPPTCPFPKRTSSPLSP